MKTNNKRLLTRVLVVCSTVLLLTVFAIPCFAIEPPTEPVPPVWNQLEPPDAESTLSRDQLLDAFYYQFQLRGDDALFRLINSNSWPVDGLPCVYQFQGVAVGDMVLFDEPLTFNDIVSNNAMLCVYDPRTSEELIVPFGHWQTLYSSSSEIRTVMFKFYEYDNLTDASTDVLTIKVRYNKDTRVVVESTVYSTVYTWIDGLFNTYTIATATGYPESCVLQYAVSTGYLRFNVAENLYTFFEGVYAGYSYGWRDGYLDGWDIGGQEWFEYGYWEGFFEGSDSGSAGGDNNGSYEQGYNDAIGDINSGDFGRNLLGSAFSAPFDALSEFTIVSWTTTGGNVVEITLGSVLSAVIGVSLFIWFLKLFAGG